MCLITEEKVPYKTQEDIIVYKLMEEDEFSGRLHSFYYKKSWRINFLYKQKIKVEEVDYEHFPNWKNSFADEDAIKRYRDLVKLHKHPVFMVTKGFHSYKSIKRAGYFFGNNVMVKCIIPAGSLVIKDKTGLIVSNQLILKEICK